MCRNTSMFNFFFFSGIEITFMENVLCVRLCSNTIEQTCICERIDKKGRDYNAHFDMAQKVQQRRLS